MKNKIISLLIVISLISLLFPPLKVVKADANSFISTWDTTLTSSGSSANNQIKLPLYLGGTYSFTVYWGDGTNNLITVYNQAAVTHTYAASGVYQITIDGTFNGFRFNFTGDKNKLLEISQWGTMRWGNNGNVFAGAANLDITATDIPNLTGISNMANIFSGSGVTDIPNINSWNVSSATYMGGMFASCNFNSPIGSWDVSHVNSFNQMFSGNESFNQPIGNWNVSNVTSLFYMFNNATAFDQPLDDWNVSSVTDMRGTFLQAFSFDQPLENWDTSNVTRMGSMFENARAFNQSLDSWEVSSVTDMNTMFAQAASFNQPLDSWDVSSVIDMHSMFSDAAIFNQPLNSWSTSNVTNMYSMFSGAENFNQPLNNWDVSSVTDISGMFHSATSFNQPIGNWDVSSVTNMNYMFFLASAFDQPIENWVMSNVTDTSSMFGMAENFNQALNNWDVSSVTSMYDMFSNAISFNQPLDSWDVSSVTDMSGMFYDALSFNQPIGDWDVSSAEYMYDMFSGAENFNQPLDSWDVSSVTDMSGMFYDAFSFDQPIGDWDVSSVAYLDYFFSTSTSNSFSTTNYDDLLINWSNLPSLQFDVVLNVGDTEYTAAAETARQSLIDNYDWIILDGGQGTSNDRSDIILYIDLTNDDLTLITTQPEIATGTATEIYFGVITREEIANGETTVFTFPVSWEVDSCAVSTTDADNDGTDDVNLATSSNIATWTYSTSTTQASTDGIQFCLQVTANTAENGVVKVVSREIEGAKAFIYAGDKNNMFVSATIYNTLHFVIKNDADTDFTNVCNLGILTSVNVDECAYRLGVSSDGYNGFDIFIDDTGATSGLALSDGNTIDQVATGTTVVTNNAEAYGIRVIEANLLVATENYSTNDNPIPITSEKIIELTGSGYNYTVGDLTTSSLVTHRATISDNTPTGIYTQTISYYVTARY